MPSFVYNTIEKQYRLAKSLSKTPPLTRKTDVEPYEKNNDLSEREMKVLQLLTKGYTDDEI